LGKTNAVTVRALFLPDKQTCSKAEVSQLIKFVASLELQLTRHQIFVRLVKSRFYWKRKHLL